MFFLSTAHVLKIHQKNIELFGGTFGVRDTHLLDSALNMPGSSFGGKFLHENIFLMAAAYLFHISKNHPFMDGNKRTAAVSMDVFLRMNGYVLKAEMLELEKLVLDTATGKTNKKEIANFLEKNSIKKN